MDNNGGHLQVARTINPASGSLSNWPGKIIDIDLKKLPKILVIVGPTASGKSALAIRLAKKLGGEIVSADSRQIYRDLDIGTGKITKREMQSIPHHLLDVASPKKVFSVAQYQKMAYKKIDDILKRGNLPIVVGGTGMYIKAIVDGAVYPEVPPNAELRRKLTELTNDKLFKLLKQLDPRRAEKIDGNNPRRLIRAIEIATVLGKVPHILRGRVRYVVTIIGLRPENKNLRFRIHVRLRRRMRQGLVSEVRKLNERGLSWKRLESLGLEYRFVAFYLQGKMTKQQMLEKLETEIWHYAKRQITWFKRDKSIIWLNKGALTN